MNEWMNIWLLYPFPGWPDLLWYLTNHAQRPGFPFVSPDCRLKYLCSWPVSILTSENKLLMSSPQVTCQYSDPVSYYFLLERVNCLIFTTLEVRVMPSKCSDDPGNKGGTDIFCDCAYYELYKKNIFLSNAAINCDLYRLNNLPKAHS